MGSPNGVQISQFRKRLNPGGFLSSSTGLKRSFHVVCASSCFLYFIHPSSFHAIAMLIPMPDFKLLRE